MNLKANLDIAGIITSIACAIHCAVLPLLISSLPVLGFNIVDNMAFECFMILLAFAIGSFALIHGYRRHHRRYAPLVLFAMGILLLFAKQYWHQYQFWLLPFAVIFIISAHISNLRLCHIHRHKDESPENPGR